MAILPGVRSTAFACTSFLEQGKNSRLSFLFTAHSNFSRKIFAGKSSCDSRLPSSAVNASQQVEIKTFMR